MTINIYTESLHRALPRLLANYNVDTTSQYYGVGDRNFWAWKLIDFANGTHQAAVHGLALLLKAGLLPDYLRPESVLTKIDSMVQGIAPIISAGGGLDEALPNEGSFCVTAMVLSDVCAATLVLDDQITPAMTDRWIEQLAPLAEFLQKQDESHGIISNHLASAALAAFRWQALTNDDKLASRGRMWLQRILDHQSSEGWFSEYGGPDPGYQSWCTTQLAQLHLLYPELNLASSLQKSLEFLSLSAHPDGSFGGTYGNRNTRFLLPGGIGILSAESPIAHRLLQFSADSISTQACVTLDSVDAGNLVPFFNDYALAAIHNKLNEPTAELLPYEKNLSQWYPHAGWTVRSSASSSYTIINFNRGGCTKHFDHSKLVYDDPGVVIEDVHGRLFSTQTSVATSIDGTPGEDTILSAHFEASRVERPHPGPLNFLLLRIASLTIFRSLALGNLIKRLLAKYLMPSPASTGPKISRRYTLQPEFRIQDQIPGGYQSIPARYFCATHMASQGYWQKSDEIEIP